MKTLIAVAVLALAGCANQAVRCKPIPAVLLVPDAKAQTQTDQLADAERRLREIAVYQLGACE